MLLPLFISYRNSGEKLIKFQANSSCVRDHVRNSHDHSVLQGTDITRRNLMLITLRAERVTVKLRKLEHMKNFRNVDCVVTNHNNVQDMRANLKTTN